jgi:hypothetical protein
MRSSQADWHQRLAERFLGEARAGLLNFDPTTTMCWNDELVSIRLASVAMS